MIACKKSLAVKSCEFRVWNLKKSIVGTVDGDAVWATYLCPKRYILAEFRSVRLATHSVSPPQNPALRAFTSLTNTCIHTIHIHSHIHKPKYKFSFLKMSNLEFLLIRYGQRRKLFMPRQPITNYEIYDSHLTLLGLQYAISGHIR